MEVYKLEEFKEEVTASKDVESSEEIGTQQGGQLQESEPPRFLNLVESSEHLK